MNISVESGSQKTSDAPFQSSIMQVEEDWIDYNGHLNMAYYNVLFDRGIDELFNTFGMGPDYAKSRNMSFFTAEVHLCYLRELHARDRVIATSQLLDSDEKRTHIFQELRHADGGWIAATSEQMSLHVDMGQRKVAPYPTDIRDRIDALLARHRSLPRPEQAGRAIGLKRR